MSASVPEARQPRYFEWGAYPHAVEEAVTSLTRLCLQREVVLVFGGHPSISPLVALVALERRGYMTAGEPPILIYQSEAFRSNLPDETWALFRAGAAAIIWTDRVEDDDERFSKSLTLMRERMISEQQPQGMVCIGGMRGIEDELALYKRHFPARRAYLLAATGGASLMLAHTKPAGVNIVEPALPARRSDGTEPDSPQPYPILLSKLLDQLFVPRAVHDVPMNAQTLEKSAAMNVLENPKRLDHLQSAISRMADNTFKLKGWCVTLVSAMLSLALKNGGGDGSTAQIAFLGVLPTLIFWLLDGYYLALERGFRKTYNDSANQTATVGPGILPPKVTLGGTVIAAFSPVTAALYGALLIVELLVGFGGLSTLVAKIH